MVCLFALTLSFCLATVTRAHSVMDHEPVEHLKAHLRKTGDDISRKLEAFLRLPEQEMRRKTAQIQKNLRKTEAHVSAFLLKGTSVLARKVAADLQFNSTFLLPYGVLLPVLATSLPILLEGYKRELLHNAMGDVLKGKHRNHKDVKDYLSLSLHDLVTKLPQQTTGDSVDFESLTLLQELNQRGRAAQFYLNTVLERVAGDAWKDALISVAMDNSVFSENAQMLTHFKDLGMYVDVLGNDLINFYEVSKSDLYPLDGGHFLYGWWFNCPHASKGDKDSACIASFLPSDSVVIFNTVVRMYSIPRLGLHLLIGSTGETARSLADVLRQDKLIWDALYSVVDPSIVDEQWDKENIATQSGGDSKVTKEAPTELHKKAEKHEVPTPGAPQPAEPTAPVPEDEVVGESKQPEKNSAGGTPASKETSSTPVKSDKEDLIIEEMEKEEDGEKSFLVRAIYTGWPFAVFLFYTLFCHVWVYWILHVLWYAFSSVFSGVYLPRPKTAKQD